MSDVSIEDFVKAKKEIDFKEIFNKYKYPIITAIYYSLGLFLGSYSYKLHQSSIVEKVLMITDRGILQLFLSLFLIYFSIFLLVMFLGFCMIGNHIINVIPAIIGIITGMKIAYYYINFGVKGIGYTLIILIPFSALFIAVLSLTIETSSQLSKSIFDAIKSKCTDFAARPYLKRYFIFGSGIILTALVNAVLIYFLTKVVTI